MSAPGPASRRSVLGAIAAIGLAAVGMAAVAAVPAPGAVRIGAAEAQRAAAFWTAERMRRARPLDRLAVGDAGPVVGPRPAPGGKPHLARPLPVAGERATGSATELVVEPAAAVSRRNGVVFFSTPFGPARCSGTSVRAPNFSLVVTAAHCVRGGGPGGEWYDRRWAFVPGYRYGQRPFGIFPAHWIDTTRQWRVTGSLNYDVGVAVVGRNAAGQRLAKAVGAAGVAWNLASRQVFDVHGYPAAPPFDGQTQQLCTGVPFLGHDTRSFLLPGPLNLAVECRLTGGASGGGWTIGGGVLNGVSSYGHRRDATTLFSPYFGREVGRLLRRAGRIR